MLSRGEPPLTMSERKKTTVRREDISEALREVGVGAGEVAIVHSSLSSMGWVEGGADTVIDAFLDVLDPTRGTLVLPTLCQRDIEHRFERWDIERSPSDVGAITETGRLRPDAVRSDHATHSVAAIGAQAHEITEGHGRAWGRPCPWGPAAFGFGSPWQWLYDHDAHYLFLGVTTSVNTIGHFAQAEFVRQIVEEAGPVGERLAREIKEWQRPGVWPQFSFELCERWLRERDAMRYATIGEATLRATRARVNVDTIIEKLRTEPETIVPDDFLDWLRRARSAAEEHQP